MRWMMGKGNQTDDPVNQPRASGMAIPGANDDGGGRGQGVACPGLRRATRQAVGDCGRSFASWSDTPCRRSLSAEIAMAVIGQLFLKQQALSKEQPLSTAFPLARND